MKPRLLQSLFAERIRLVDVHLALIHELTRAAEERLVLVHRLDGELRRMRGA